MRNLPGVAPLLAGLFAGLVMLSACGPRPPLDEPPALRPTDLSPPVKRGELQGDELLRTLDQVAESSRRRNSQGEQELLAFAKHADYLIRVQAVKALGDSFYRKNDAALKALIAALDDDFWLVRGFAVRALAREDRAEAKDALVRRLQSESHERVVYYIQEALSGKQAMETLPSDGF